MHTDTDRPPEDTPGSERARLVSHFRKTLYGGWFVLPRLADGFAETTNAFARETREVFGQHGTMALAYLAATIARTIPPSEEYRTVLEAPLDRQALVDRYTEQMAHGCGDPDHDHDHGDDEDVRASAEDYADAVEQAIALGKDFQEKSAPGREADFARMFRPSERGMVQDMAVNGLLSKASVVLAEYACGPGDDASRDELLDRIEKSCEDAADVFADIALQSLGSAP